MTDYTFDKEKLKMREFFYRFFKGRYGSYGTDILTRFLLVVAVVCLLASICTPLDLLYYLSFIILIYCYFRLFSKNITKRYHENEIFNSFLKKLASPVRNIRQNAYQCKNYRIYRCPDCGQRIRIPRGKGHIIVMCPKCKAEFRKTC